MAAKRVLAKVKAAKSGSRAIAKTASMSAKPAVGQAGQAGKASRTRAACAYEPGARQGAFVLNWVRCVNDGKVHLSILFSSSVVL